MAQYYTDFSEYTSDQQPSGWTERGDDYDYLVRDRTGVTGGKVLEISQIDGTTVDGAFSILSWDTIDSDANRADTEMQFRFRFPSDVANHKVFAAVRVAMSGSTIDDCYHFQMQEGNNRQAIGMINSGSYSVFDGNFDEISGGVQLDTWYRARFRVNGTTIQSRVWTDGDTEPASWEFTETDSNVSGAGYVGVGEYSDNALIEYDWIGVATNGDTAPSTDPGGTSVSVSDSVGVSDSVNQLSNAFTQSDSVSLADSIAEVLNNFTVSDSVSVADTNDFDIEFIIADSVSISDSVNNILNEFTLQDSITASDSVSVSQGVTNISVSDSLSISDSIASVEVIFTVQDAVSLLDSVSIGADIVVVDTVSFTESLGSLSNSLSVSDAISITESVTKTTIGDATKLVITTKELYQIALEAKNLYNITLNVDEKIG